MKRDTMTPDLFSQDDDGRSGRDDGMRRAYDHAIAESSDWGERAYSWLLAFAQDRRTPFSTMECRKAAYRAGLVRPPTEFAWGSVVTRAVKSGVLVRAGDDNVGDGTSHSKLTPLWLPVRWAEVKRDITQQE